MSQPISEGDYLVKLVAELAVQLMNVKPADIDRATRQELIDLVELIGNIVWPTDV